MSSVGDVLGLKKIKPPAPPAPPGPNQADVIAAEQEQRRLALNAKGRSSTLLNGFGGDKTAAQTARKTLLGT